MKIWKKSTKILNEKWKLNLLNCCCCCDKRFQFCFMFLLRFVPFFTIFSSSVIFVYVDQQVGQKITLLSVSRVLKSWLFLIEEVDYDFSSIEPSRSKVAFSFLLEQYLSIKKDLKEINKNLKLFLPFSRQSKDDVSEVEMQLLTRNLVLNLVSRKLVDLCLFIDKKQNELQII